MHVAATSDFENVMNCRVMDEVYGALLQAAQHFQYMTMFLLPTGLLRPQDVNKIQQYIQGLVQSVAGPDLSFIQANVYSQDNVLSTQKLRTSINMVPKGYFKNIEFDVGFLNPQVQTLPLAA